MAKSIDGGFLPEDDPIFKEGWTIFTPRQRQPVKSGQGPEEKRPEASGSSENPSGAGQDETHNTMTSPMVSDTTSDPPKEKLDPATELLIAIIGVLSDEELIEISSRLCRIGNHDCAYAVEKIRENRIDRPAK